MAASSDTVITDFPCSLDLEIPFPTQRLATVAYKALAVDKELSPLVTRSFDVKIQAPEEQDTQTEPAVLLIHYRATTNRMLRVAVNGFMDALNLVLEIMENLDQDVLPGVVQQQQ